MGGALYACGHFVPVAFRVFSCAVFSSNKLVTGLQIEINNDYWLIGWSSRLPFRRKVHWLASRDKTTCYKQKDFETCWTDPTLMYVYLPLAIVWCGESTCGQSNFNAGSSQMKDKALLATITAVSFSKCRWKNAPHVKRATCKCHYTSTVAIRKR